MSDSDIRQCSTEGCTNPQARAGNKRRQCLDCLAAYQRRYRAKNRGRAVRPRFGLKPGEYERMLLAQGNQCGNPACHTRVEDAPQKRLMLGPERKGLLCEPCYKAIALTRQDPALLRGLIDFLEGRRTYAPMILSKALMEPIKNPDQPDDSDESGAGRSREGR